MSTCMLPPKGLSLISFLTQVLLPEGSLEYSNVIKTLYMFRIGVLCEFFATEREREAI